MAVNVILFTFLYSLAMTSLYCLRVHDMRVKVRYEHLFRFPGTRSQMGRDVSAKRASKQWTFTNPRCFECK